MAIAFEGRDMFRWFFGAWKPTSSTAQHWQWVPHGIAHLRIRLRLIMQGRSSKIAGHFRDILQTCMVFYQLVITSAEAGVDD